MRIPPTIRFFAFLAVLAAFSQGSLAGDEAPDSSRQWGQWRGPRSNGVAPRGNPPVEWSETKNLRWKAALPGRGHSTPIVWDRRIYLTAAIPHGEAVANEPHHADGAHNNLEPSHKQRFVVIALDRGTGEIVWQTTVRDARPHEGTHETGTWASASAVTDGARIYAFFGSRGLFALDPKGRLLWEADLGEMEIFHGHGEGSSPALWGDTLVVNWDHQGQSFVAAYDKRNGKQRWRTDREEITSWSTPLVVEHAGRRQVVVAATRRVRSYDLADGSLIWELSGLSRNVVASPVAADGLVYVASSYDTRALMAVRLDAAKGDITDSDAIAWRTGQNTPYVPSPVLDGDTLCFMKHLHGILSCLDASSGAPRFRPVRIDDLQQVFASPVGAGGRLYIASRNGATAVVRHEPRFELLAVNHLDDAFSASPAVAGNELFLRGERNLYCIATETAESSSP